MITLDATDDMAKSRREGLLSSGVPAAPGGETPGAKPIVPSPPPPVRTPPT